jgi:hypothetical protein
MLVYFRVLILALFVLLFTSQQQVFAQNIQRIEEEAIKDRERELKKLQLLQQQKEEEERILQQPLSEDDMASPNLVEVEPNNILPSDLANVYTLVPYKVRRTEWGHHFAITYCQFNPTEYQTDYEGAGVPMSDGQLPTYENAYGAEPMVELSYGVKWNFLLGSLVAELGYGIMSNAADNTDLGDATLNLQTIRTGVRYNLDNITYEPYLVPYGFAGAYTILYAEEQAGASFDGNTSPALYWGGGVMFQLGWLDPIAAVEAYAESGIENTYLFAEVRQYMASSEEIDPDFSTGLDLNFGMSLEF